MLSYVWRNGKPYLKTLAQLPKTMITIPQPDGTRVEISMKDPESAKRKLGVMCAPSGNFSDQVESMVKSGLHHASCLRAHHVPPREARMSVNQALMPKILYGIVAVNHPPALLEKAFHKIYHEVLPNIGVNRKITRAYRMLPEQYQGLGLVNPNIEALCAKIQLIRANWEANTTMGHLLTQAYQVFQMEVGLGGNIFTKPFTELGHLATHGFFRSLWELLDLYGVSFMIHNTHDIPLLREDDRMIMDAIVETGIFNGSELDQINRVRHHKKVSSVGDLVDCDGMSISPEILTPTVGVSRREFPRQQPTHADVMVWSKAIGSLCRGGQKLIKSLGSYTSSPHKPDDWFINDIKTEIFHKSPTGQYEQYTLEESHRSTRFGAKYLLQDVLINSPPLDRRLTPREWSGNVVLPLVMGNKDDSGKPSLSNPPVHHQIPRKPISVDHLSDRR